MMRTRAAPRATALGSFMEPAAAIELTRPYNLGRDGPERVVQRGNRRRGTALFIMDGAPRAVKSLIRMR